MLTVFGVIAISIMFLSYWTEARSKWLVLIFAIGSGMTSLYSGLEEVYPITVIEGLWALVALKRFWQRHLREKEDAGVGHTPASYTRSAPSLKTERRGN